MKHHVLIGELALNCYVLKPGSKFEASAARVLARFRKHNCASPVLSQRETTTVPLLPEPGIHVACRWVRSPMLSVYSHRL